MTQGAMVFLWCPFKNRVRIFGRLRIEPQITDKSIGVGRDCVCFRGKGGGRCEGRWWGGEPMSLFLKENILLPPQMTKEKKLICPGS